MLALTPAEEAALANTVDRAVSMGLRHGGALGKAPKDEPQAVVAVYSTLATLKPAWSKVFAAHGAQASMSGAFIHGKPYVRFNGPFTPTDCCELGDLLLVVDDVRRGQEDRRALITQAKPVSGPRLAIYKPNERKQLHLNMNWPVFTFVGSEYGNNAFDFRDLRAPGAVGDSSAYGAVDIAGATWEQIPPSSAMLLGSGSPLSTTISEMVVGRAGRKAEHPSASATPCGDDWSEAIRLVLENSAKAISGSTLGATRRAYSFFSSGAGDPVELDLVVDNALFEDPGSRPPPSETDVAPGDERRGMSVFRITISDLDDERYD